MTKHPDFVSIEGFSLIELMVSITIVALFVLLAMPTFSAWLMNTKIRTAAESISNGLLVARNEAVRRNANVQFVLGSGSSWSVSCQAVAPACPDLTPIQSRSTGDGSDSTITVAANNGTTIVFNSFGLMIAPVVAVGDIVSFDVDGPNTTESRELRVMIRSGGSIRMCDPQVTGTDPRAC